MYLILLHESFLVFHGKHQSVIESVYLSEVWLLAPHMHTTLEIVMKLTKRAVLCNCRHMYWCRNLSAYRMFTARQRCRKLVIYYAANVGVWWKIDYVPWRVNSVRLDTSPAFVTVFIQKNINSVGYQINSDKYQGLV